MGWTMLSKRQMAAMQEAVKEGRKLTRKDYRAMMDKIMAMGGHKDLGPNDDPFEMEPNE